MAAGSKCKYLLYVTSTHALANCRDVQQIF